MANGFILLILDRIRSRRPKRQLCRNSSVNAPVGIPLKMRRHFICDGSDNGQKSPQAVANFDRILRYDAVVLPTAY